MQRENTNFRERECVRLGQWQNVDICVTGTPREEERGKNTRNILSNSD